MDPALFELTVMGFMVVVIGLVGVVARAAAIHRAAKREAATGDFLDMEVP